MRISSILVVTMVGYSMAKSVGDICGTDSSKGVCEPTSWCNNRDGTVSEAGLCPGTPNNVRCCYYPKCSSPYTRGFCKPTWEVDGVGVACWGRFVRYVRKSRRRVKLKRVQANEEIVATVQVRTTTRFV